MPRLLALVLGPALALLAAPPLAAAEYYKWVDEDGVTHYSQQPPPEDERARVEAEAVTLPARTPEAPPGANGASSSDPAGAGNGDGDGGADTVAEFCQDMRAQEEMLASDRPVRMKNDDGTLEPLAGDARRKRLDQVRGQLDKHCDGRSAGGDGGAAEG